MEGFGALWRVVEHCGALWRVLVCCGVLPCMLVIISSCLFCEDESVLSVIMFWLVMMHVKTGCTPMD